MVVIVTAQLWLADAQCCFSFWLGWLPWQSSSGWREKRCPAEWRLYWTLYRVSYITWTLLSAHPDGIIQLNPLQFQFDTVQRVYSRGMLIYFSCQENILSPRVCSFIWVTYFRWCKNQSILWALMVYVLYRIYVNLFKITVPKNKDCVIYYSPSSCLLQTAKKVTKPVHLFAIRLYEK